jgi:UDP-N-acetylglucosamine diphosphorylase/glucosamine-1-phosphate N-acetyltransferase
LAAKYPRSSNKGIHICALFIPDTQLLKQIEALKEGQVLMQDESPLAFHSDEANPYLSTFEPVLAQSKAQLFPLAEQLFLLNSLALEFDYELITKGRRSQAISKTNTVLGDRLFMEEGAEIECSIINTNTGSVYLSNHASIMEGCMVRGGLALCEGAQLKMGAKIYGYTTIGPHSKVGGEVNNSVITGFSNKAHDGFLGNSVIGEWCNLGADSNNSNLKNNYAEVKLWDYTSQRFRKTGQQFLGLIMADHAKCGINTMFNTGTVVGVAANVFGSGFPRNFVPDFAWGGAHGFEVYQLNKVFEVAEKVYARRGLSFGENEKQILTEIFNQTEAFRASFA